MKKCSRCGAEHKDEINFCPNCGTNLNESEHTPSNDKNLIERFRDANIILKLIIIIIAVFVIVVASAWIMHIFFGMPFESFTEYDDTYHNSQFDSLDIDGDHALSFYEVESLAQDIPYDNLSDIFNYADKNDNNVLKGAEFDGYLNRIDKYYNELAKQQNAEKEKAAQQKSSPSSSKTPSLDYEGHEICPECGSDQITEFYNEEYGEMDWQCDDCGEIYRSDDYLYVDYWEQRGVDCVLPVLENKLAII